MMLIINDFFKRRKEAVSNQMESLLHATDGTIVSATRFMGQKALRWDDFRQKIFIFPPLLYPVATFFAALFHRGDIHVFEEEPSKYKRLLFNFLQNDLYVSMYRKPFLEYSEHLLRYHGLKGVFVELESHKNILVSHGVPESIIHISPTPAKIPRAKNSKLFNPRKVHILFASWNTGEGSMLRERGLVYLADMLVKNPNFSLTVLLRDNNTVDFERLISKKGVTNRVRLIDVDESDLVAVFDEADFVVYAIQETLTKDVPNSLIDGLSRGKPVILSDVFGFAETVKKEGLGYVIKRGAPAERIIITKSEYNEMSRRAYIFSKEHTTEIYVSNIVKEYLQV